MTLLEGIRWVKNKLAETKKQVFKIRMNSLTNSIKTIYHRTSSIRVKVSAWKQSSNQTLSKTNQQTHQIKQRMVQVDWKSRIRSYRMQMVKGVGGLGLLAAITMGGNHYVEANTVEVFHVLVNNEEIGVVSNPQVVDDFKIEKYKKIEDNNPNSHVILNTDAVTLKSERAFKKEVDNQATLAKLDGMLSSRTVGIQIVIDGKIIGNVKDKDTAEQIFSQIKGKYMTAKTKDASRVSILSASSTTDLNPGESEQQKIDFVQKIELNPIDIQPNTLMDPQDVLTKLQTGDVQPTKYTVEKGDCVSCIAKKFSISKQVIYQNNPWIVDDILKIGQKIDLTVLQPTLSVQTVEKVVENQEIQYDTDYQKDDSMRLDQSKRIDDGRRNA
jgi:LysM repeat protein